MPAQTISRFGRVYVNFDPDGPGGGPPTWVLGSAGDGSSGTSVISQGTYTPADGSTSALVGAPLYFKSAGVLDLAKAIDSGTAGAAQSYEVAGLAAATTAPGAIVGLITDGRVSRNDWTPITGSRTLSVGKRYYLSDGYAGQLVSTCPATSGATVISVGQAIGVDTLEVEITFICKL